MTFIPPEDYTVRLVDDMPIHQGGMIAESPDGHLNIYINARLSCSSQGAAFWHECDHANDDDLNSDRDIREVERHTPPRKPVKLPKLMRARDLIPRRYTRPTDIDDWQNDIYHRLGEEWI